MVFVGENAELRTRVGQGPKGKAWLLDKPAREAASAACHGEASAKPSAAFCRDGQGGADEADLRGGLDTSGAPLFRRHQQEGFRRGKVEGCRDQGAEVKRVWTSQVPNRFKE